MTSVLETIAAQSGNRIKTEINPGEGAFYGPKFEYVLRDAIGREWQCGTTQVDFNLPERFGAFYIGSDGEKKQPVMVHRAICGSMERFLGILIEHLPAISRSGSRADEQIVVCPITSEADAYAEQVTIACSRDESLGGPQGARDLRNEKISYKVREHSLAKVPGDPRPSASARRRSARSTCAPPGLPADRLFRDQGRAEEQHGRAP
jgi:threonyl-tRNA synthetase